MPPGNSPQLSKTRFMAGLQCLKRLYLECYDRDLADPVDETQQAIFDTGTGVGELARVPKPPSYYRDNRRRLVGKGHLKTKLGDRRN